MFNLVKGWNPRYRIIDKDSGAFISEWDTIDEAIAEMERYAALDCADACDDDIAPYLEFYEIVEIY